MMAIDALRFGQVDLSSCEREPIHIPGSIQPHGALLVVDRNSLAIVQHAGDTQFLLGIAAAGMTQLTLEQLFDGPALHALVARLHPVSPTLTPALLLGLSSRTGAQSLDASLHCQGERAIIELEAARRSHTEYGDLAQLQAMLGALQSPESPEACCTAAAKEVRRVVGFDRVMIYQFLHDDSGKVIAEDRAEGMEPYLGLHYPASDIPRQARELYLRNLLRLIPDINYIPAPLIPAAIGDEPPTLDMSLCVLRSVSPIHLEYPRNMGVRASMSISIIIGNKLWGLIACHHDTPRFVPADLRVACELFSRILALQLEAKLETAAARRSLVPRRVLLMLADRLLLASNLGAELVRGDTTALDLFPAVGVAVWLDGTLHTQGETPSVEFIAELLAWLKDQPEPLFATHQLSLRFPPALRWTKHASGLLAISLSRDPADFVLWFRPEVVHTVTWAGNPDKPVSVGPHGDRLTPRKSFEAWQAEIRAQAMPWTDEDIETARTFRLWLLETVLRQMNLARQAREASYKQQNLLMAELDHRVKNTLASTKALVRQTKAGAGSIDEFALSLEMRIQAMAHAHNLMAETRWQGASLLSLLHKELAPYRTSGDGLLRLGGPDLILSHRAAMPFTMVIHELTTNAAKYGALSTATGCIDIHWQTDKANGALLLTWQESHGPAVTPPRRRGFGSVVIERSLRHELQGKSMLSFEPEGVRCVITIPAECIISTPQSGAVHD